MISFECDYNNGTLPEILQRLASTNDTKTPGYGADDFTASARDKIRRAVGMPEADVHFLVGGTQTNATVIDSVLSGGEGVIAVPTAHIAVHESGAVEAFGHKVITLPSSDNDSKLKAATLRAYMRDFYADETYPHMVQPGMVYVSNPTELGMIYSRTELEELYEACREFGLKLYIDGARLGYALVAEECDYDLPFLARHCDVFYIGGTKVGALFGEAVVFSGMKAPRNFFTNVKRHGALLAKGRLLGLQFDVLFTDDLYFRVSRHALRMAEKLKSVFSRYGIRMAIPSSTNQQFALLSARQYEALQRDVAFEVWERRSEEELMCRFVTCPATTEADIEGLDEILSRL